MNEFRQFWKVDLGTRCEWVLDQFRQVVGAEVTATIGRERLFTTVLLLHALALLTIHKGWRE